MIEEEETEESSVLSFAKMLKDVIDQNIKIYVNTVREDAGAAIKLREVCDRFRCGSDDIIERIDRVQGENVDLKEKLKGVDVIKEAKVHYFPLLQVLITRAQGRGDVETVNIINDFLISGRLP